MNKSESNNRRNKNKAFILMSASGASGAEKRFARTFLYLRQKGENYHFIVNQSLCDDIVRQGIRLDKDKNVAVLSHIAWLPMSNAFFRKLYLLVFPWQCMKYIAQKNIRVVHLVVNGVYLGFPFLFYKKVAVVVSIVDPGFDSTITPAAAPLYKFILRNADALDLLSEDLKKQLIGSKYNSGHLLDSRAFVTPCSFIDYDKIVLSPPKKNWITFLGRFDEMKNPMLFVESVPYITRRFPDFEFFLLGRGPLEGKIKQRLHELDLTGKVYSLFASKPEEYLTQSRIFLSLQTFNNYPSQSLIEAMACENAIVATDVGETWKLVDETNGLRVTATPEAVAEAVCTLLSRDRIRELGKNARKKVLEEHTIDRFASYLQNIHERVVPQNLK